MSSSQTQTLHPWHSSGQSFSSQTPQYLHSQEPHTPPRTSGFHYSTPHSTSRVDPTSSPFIVHPIVPPSQIPPAPQSQSMRALPQHNEAQLTPELLCALLDHLSLCLASPHAFNGAQVTLVVHGGAVMLLHPGLSQLAQDLALEGQQYNEYHPQANTTALDELGIFPRRTSTRDIDFIARGFTAAWATQGIDDGEDRLRKCIKSTAYAFYNLGIGEDWVNSEADVSLPMAKDPKTGASYDPIIRRALQPNNISVYTVYESPNKVLRLVAVSPAWAVALKLVRYGPRDWADVALILRNGSHIAWTADTVESWLRSQCSAMLFDQRDAQTKKELRRKIEHAVAMFHRGGQNIFQRDESSKAKTRPIEREKSTRTNRSYQEPRQEVAANVQSNQRPSYLSQSHHRYNASSDDEFSDLSESKGDIFLTPTFRQRPRSPTRQSRPDITQPFIPPVLEPFAEPSSPVSHEHRHHKKERKSKKKKRDRDRATDRQSKPSTGIHLINWDIEQPRRSVPKRPSIYDMSNVDHSFTSLRMGDVPNHQSSTTQPTFNNINAPYLPSDPRSYSPSPFSTH